MIRFLLIAFGAFVLVSMVAAMVVALIMAIVTLAVMALVIGVPIYFLVRHVMRDPSIPRVRQNPLERLQNLYIEGKIDLFEYERRVAQLIAVEQF